MGFDFSMMLDGRVQNRRSGFVGGYLRCRRSVIVRIKAREASPTSHLNHRPRCSFTRATIGLISSTVETS